MTARKTLRVSIVIPVYNEAERIAACLEAIAAQTVKPYEVIVVDNNSTDDTVALAARYRFVQILHEPKQGVVYARGRGFDTAQGEVIGRIDADTVLAPGWVAAVRRAFTDQSLGAVTGKVSYQNVALGQQLSRLDLFVRRYMARTLGPEVALQGANMAIRRSAWQEIKPELCLRGDLHEDFDLAVHANWHGWNVRFSEDLVAAISYRQSTYSFGEFCQYALTSPRTYKAHGLTSQKYMYPVVWLVIACYLPLKFLSQGYDEETGTFSWSQALAAPLPARVNPATFVD